MSGTPSHSPCSRCAIHSAENAGEQHSDSVRLADSRAARNACTSRATTLGATYRIERTTLKAGYGHQRLDGSTSRFASLGVDHALSPRTTLNASLGYRRDASAGGRTALDLGVSQGF